MNFQVEKGPHVTSLHNSQTMMRNLLIALIPIILFAFYRNGLKLYLDHETDYLGLIYPILFMLIASLTTFITELVITLIMKHKLDFKALLASYPFLPGLFLSLVVPIKTSLLVLVIGCVIASLVKCLSGGFGKNLLNPALTGYAAILLLYFFQVFSAPGYVEAVSQATPLTNAGLVSGLGTYEALVGPYTSLWQLLLGNYAGALGETSALLCLIGFLYLVYTKTIKWRIPIIYIATVFIIAMLMGLYNNVGLWYPLFNVLTGGLCFGAIFMATDPVTSPVTLVGQILYALGLGILTMAFRYLSPFSEGVCFSIVIMNLLVPILDRLGVKASFNRYVGIVSTLLMIILMGLLSVYLGGLYHVDPETTSSDFVINSKEMVVNGVVYNVSGKGFSGNITLEVTILNNQVTNIKVLATTDHFMNAVTDSNYLNDLITNQTALDQVDAISGATYSSNGIKNIIKNVLIDYQKNKVQA